MIEKLNNYFNSAYENKKIGHAYLIGNVSLDEIYASLNNILSNYFFNAKINIYENSDIYVLKTDKKIISKSVVLSIQEHIELTSQLSNYKIYIIDEAEKMNISASNSLLKTLEEPEDNVIAFLITKNINLIIPTIKSRCQVIQISSEVGNKDLEIPKDEILKFAYDLETLKKDAIAYENKYFDKNNAQEKFRLYIASLFHLYDCALNYEINNNFSDNIYDREELLFLINSNSIKKLSQKLIIIHDIIELLDLNLNIGLLIDKFIIEFGGC